MDQGADALLQAALARPSPEDLSDIEVDGDGSSSLSDIEDKDAEQEEDVEGTDDELSNISDDEDEENGGKSRRWSKKHRKARKLMYDESGLELLGEQIGPLPVGPAKLQIQG